MPCVDDVPFVVDGPDDKSQGWTDSIHILIHKPFDDCGFSSIVQSSSTWSAIHSAGASIQISYNIKILISLSFNRAFRRIDNIVEIVSVWVGEMCEEGNPWLGTALSRP